MNNPTSPDTPEIVTEAPASAPAAPVAPPPNDNRRRLRELLSVPERDRTDEQWDEIIELEIQLAPGNRISGPEQGFGGGGLKPNQNRGAGGPHQKKHRPRNNNSGGGNPGGNAGGGGNAGNGGGGNRRPRQNKPPQGNPAA